MALPGNAFSSQPVRGDYLPPYDRDQADPLVDWETGGTALEDASAGLQVQIWRLTVIRATGDFIVTPESFGAPTTVITRPGFIRRAGLAFDQLMRPVLGWIQDDVLYLRWFDATINQQVISSFGPVDDMRVLLDDPRSLQTVAGTSDALLFYVRAGKIFYRQQRDRYTIERELATFTDPNALVRSYGRTTRNRIEFEVRQP